MPELRDALYVDGVRLPVGRAKDTGYDAQTRADEYALLSPPRTAESRAGFPFFLGGICRHLDPVGISRKVAGGDLVGEEDAAFAG